MSHFDKPKFLSLLQYFLNTNCDMEDQVLQRHEVDRQIRNNPLPQVLNKAMRLFIIEIIPGILVSDGHNFLEAIFTREAINDFRKYHSHVKFSSLRDKVIYVQKWSLQVDQVDSRKCFNSYNNLSIKIVIESFKPMMHEQLNQRLTHGSTSIFRNLQIQTLIRSYRHWFAQTLVSQNPSTLAEDQDMSFPSFDDIFKPSQIQNNFGAIIQKSQVFRVDQDFQNRANLKLDSFDDLPQFASEVAQKKQIQNREMRFADLERIIIQEKGEQFYAEKKFNKSRQWLETVEDEFRRDQLRLKIEYFQIGKQEATEAHCYETKWQNEERQKSYRLNHYRSTRRIVGYTLGNSVESIKEKLIKLLKCSKFNTDATRISSSSPMKVAGRPRSNSQENILITKDTEDSKSNLLDTEFMQPRKMCREPLSQFVQHKMPEFHDDDTQSEPDSMDEMSEMEAQLYKESKNMIKSEQEMRQKEIDEVVESAEPMAISLYRSYLEWFTQNELARVAPTEIPKAKKEKPVQKQVESQATKPESEPVQDMLNTQVNTQAVSVPVSASVSQDIKVEDDIEMPTGTTGSPPEQAPTVLAGLPEIKEECPDVEMTESINESDHQKYEEPIPEPEMPMKDLNEDIVLQEKEEEFADLENINAKLKQREVELSESLQKDLIKSWDRKERQNQIVSKLEVITNQMQEIKKESQLMTQIAQAKELKLKEESDRQQEILKKEKAEADRVAAEEFARRQRRVEELPEEEREIEQMELEVTIQARDLNEKLASMEEKKKLIGKKKKDMEDKKAREAKEVKRLEAVAQRVAKLEQEATALRQEAEVLQAQAVSQDHVDRSAKQELESIERQISHNKTRILAKKVKREQEAAKRLEQERLLQEQQRIEKEKAEEERRQAQLIKEENERNELKKLLEIKQKEAEAKVRQEEMQRKQQAEAETAEKAAIKQNQPANNNQVDRRLRAIEEQKLRAIERQKRLKRQEEETKAKRLQEEEEVRQAELAKTQMAENGNQDDTLEDDDLDWQEGSVERSEKQSQQVSQEWHKTVAEEGENLEHKRQSYVNDMTKKFGNQLSHEIRKCETRDLSRRDIKKSENNDKLYDYMQIKRIKDEKLEHQKRQQILQEQSSHDSKQNSPKDKTNQEKLEYIKNCDNYKIGSGNGYDKQEQSFQSSEKMSSQGDEHEQNDYSTKYDLFQDQQEPETKKPDDNSESFSEIAEDDLNQQKQDNVGQQGDDQTPQPSEIQTPEKQVNQAMPPPAMAPATAAGASEQTILALQQQIFALTQALGTITQQVTILGSQNTTKQVGPPQETASAAPHQTPKQERDYFVPSFGSQAQVNQAATEDNSVKPFNVDGSGQPPAGSKRSFSEITQEAKYTRNEFDKLADEARMKEHRKTIEAQKRMKEMKYKHHVRKSVGHPDHREHSSHSQQNQDFEPRQRDRNRMRSQSQERQQPMQPHRQRQDGSPRKSSTGRSRSPESHKGHFDLRHSQNMQTNRVNGNKRYTHSQATGQFTNQDIQKRRRLTEVPQQQMH